MKLKKLLDYIFYQNGFTTGEQIILSGITLVSLAEDTTLIYTDINGDEWSCNTGTTSPSLVDSNTTGITLSTVPYLGGSSALTYQMIVTNNHGYNVTSESSFRSLNTAVATVSSGGLITGAYTGSTKIAVAHNDGPTASSNTFVFSPTTGLTINTIPYIGGVSAYTYQMVVTDDYGHNVTPSCTFTSINTNVATVSVAGLVTGVYTGSTKIGVAHDGGAASSSNTFTVNQIVSSLTFKNYAGVTLTAVTLFSGVTSTGYTVYDQQNNIVSITDLTGVFSGYTGATNTVSGVTLGNTWSLTLSNPQSCWIRFTELRGTLVTTNIPVSCTAQTP